MSHLFYYLTYTFLIHQYRIFTFTETVFLIVQKIAKKFFNPYIPQSLPCNQTLLINLPG